MLTRTHVTYFFDIFTGKKDQEIGMMNVLLLENNCKNNQKYYLEEGVEDENRKDAVHQEPNMLGN